MVGTTRNTILLLLQADYILLLIWTCSVAYKASSSALNSLAVSLRTYKANIPGSIRMAALCVSTFSFLLICFFYS